MRQARSGMHLRWDPPRSFSWPQIFGISACSLPVQGSQGLADSVCSTQKHSEEPSARQ